MPFNHIYFTGSPKVGKIVMQAAGKNLTSVTLELGGKSPVVIDQTANLDHAARRIIWGKLINAGQVCVAPDYVLIQDSVKEKFLGLIRKYLMEFYTDEPRQSEDLARIIHQKGYNRLHALITEAVQQGSTIIYGGDHHSDQNYIAPTVLADVPLQSKIMQEEIFGPVLPVITFHDKNEAIEIIRNLETPLCLYIYSRNRKNIRWFLQESRAGTSCINHNVVQYFNHHLPFGGVNNSGIGNGHGHFSFLEFSNARAVLKQSFPVSTTRLIYPPINRFKQRVVDIFIKWF